jgi:DNA-binding CsgD family transcriptional regulator
MIDPRTATKPIRRAFDEWRRAMAVIDLSRPRVETAPLLRTLLEVDVGLVFTVDRTDDQLRFAPGEISGASSVMVDELERHYGDGQPAGMFSIEAPHRAQRDRIMNLGKTSRLFELASRDQTRLGFSRQGYAQWVDGLTRMQPIWKNQSLFEHHQLRILVCEGPALIGYLCAMHVESLGAQHQRRLRSVVPIFRRRLMIEQRLREGAKNASLLAAALDALSSAAFIVTPGGRVIVANAAGQLMLARDRAVLEKIRRALRGIPEQLGRVSAISEAGSSDRLLVEFPIPYLEACTERRIEELRLTPRQCDALRLLVRGASYRAIAVSLRCSPRTVEHHVAQILAKADVATTSQLIVWLTR